MKLTKAEMQLFTLGAALVGHNPTAARIVANALSESTARRERPKAKKSQRTKKT